MRYDKLKRKLGKIKYSIGDQKPTYLTNNDFTNGTYIIDTPGYYKLSEDIIFDPNKNSDHFPIPSQTKYQSAGFVLGFFAAIVIQADNVYLDLNGYTLQASEEFTLQQRFFALIELGSAPFIPPQGPADFGSSFISPNNVIISNGTLGLSSHHGIHGNSAKNVLIEHLTITEFEVAAVSLNGSSNVIMKHIDAKHSRQNVPVLATYSAARFARFFAKSLLNRNVLSGDYKSRLETALSALETVMNIAHDQILSTGKTNVTLFNNKEGLPDGTVFGILVHSKGVAVNDVDINVDRVNNVFLDKVSVDDLKSNVHEVIGLSGPDGVGCQVDVAGAVFRIDLCNKDGIYQPDPLSDLQLLLAEISINLGIPLGKTSITMDTIEWAKNKSPISSLLNNGYKYKCSSDSMFHVSKPTMGYRLGGIDNLLIKKCTTKNISNQGKLGNDVLDGNYTTSHDAQHTEGYNGNGVVGINISYCSNVNIYKHYMKNLFSYHGSSTGINVVNKSDSYIENTTINKVWAGTKVGSEWVGQDYYGNSVNYNNDLPNRLPCAVGINIDKHSKAKLKRVLIKGLSGPCEKPVRK